MADNYREEATTRKRGRSVSKLSVKLFLLDPDKKITKVTKDIGSEKGLNELKQKGYGPPSKEYCVAGDKVEFSLQLTNEEFKQKLVEIYPGLKNVCFMFMKAGKDNTLKELNPGVCCYRCYTPENVYSSERGQGKLYIQIICENEISPCTHGEPLIKRLHRTVGGHHQRFVPIAPKPGQNAGGIVTQTPLLSTVETFGPKQHTSLSEKSVAQGVSSSTISDAASRPEVRSSGSTVIQRQLPTPAIVVSQSVSTPAGLGSIITNFPNFSSSESQGPPQSFNFTNAASDSQILRPEGVFDTISRQSSPNFSFDDASNPNDKDIKEGLEISEEELMAGMKHLKAFSPSNTAGTHTDSSTKMFQTEETSSHEANGGIPELHDSNTVSSAEVAHVSRRMAQSSNLVADVPKTQKNMKLHQNKSHFVESSVALSQPSASSIVSQSAPTPSIDDSVSTNSLPSLSQRISSSVNMVPQQQLPPPATVSQISLTTPFTSSFNLRPRTQVATQATNSQPNQPFDSSVDLVPQVQLTTSATDSQTASTPPVNGILPQGQLPTLATNRFPAPSQSFGSSVNMVSQGQSPASSTVSQIAPIPPVNSSFNNLLQGPFNNSVNLEQQRQLATSATGFQLASRQVQPFVSGNKTPESQISRSAEVFDESIAQFLSNVSSQMVAHSDYTPFNTDQELEGPETGSQVTNEAIRGLHGSNIAPSAVSSHASSRITPSPSLSLLADVVGEAQREQWENSITSGANIQENFEPEQKESRIVKFLQNVELTRKLEIPLDVLNNDALLKKLNESTISIHTVEIQSTCEVHQVLNKFSLPTYLRILRIRENSLSFDDITDLVKCLRSVNNLRELDLCRTKFNERTFFIFLSAFHYCEDLTVLILTDNSLTEKELNGLITVFESVKNLKTLNLSKCILTETQANAILHKHEQAKNIVSLDLSHNAIQGNEIVVGICQLQSLQEVDLSHNCVRFSPLPRLEGKRDLLSTCTKLISLSFNHMTPDDICHFCSLIRSNLSKLNLDFNHVAVSIWSLCSLGKKIKHLKELSLANTDICDNVDGLAFLLSLVQELENLNLSSNNLLADDFRQLQTPLSKLAQLKTLNLSRNAIGPDGMKALANTFDEFRLLERLDMSSSYIREDEISILCKNLVSLKKLKYLNLSGNSIDIEVLGDALVLPATLEELLFSDVMHGQKLFDEMRQLKNLRKLYLNKLILRGCDVEALTAMLPCFLKLEELSLAYLVAPECETIITAMKSLKNIQKIDLNNIRLSNDGALADMLSSLLSLEELVLTDMGSTNMDYERLFSAMKSLKRLRSLSLGGVEVASIHSKTFFDMLSCLSSLKDIVFPDLRIDSDRIPLCFDGLESLRYVRSLDISSTEGRILKFSESNLARVLTSLQLLEKLKLNLPFYFESNDKSANELYVALRKLKYLKELSIVSSDWQRVAGRDALVEVLSSLQLLEKLELIGFPLETDDCKQLFNALGKLRYLKEFSCLRILKWHCNKFIPQAGMVAFSHALSSLKLLEKLALGIENLSNNEYIEQLCAVLGDLKYLKKLDLYFEKITNSEAEALTKMLPSLELLEELKLRTDMVWDWVDSEHTKLLLAAIGKLRYLKKLHLPVKALIDFDYEASLAKMLSSLRLLQKLNIKMIGISQSETKELFITVGKLKYLKKLKLCCDIELSRNNVDVLIRALLSLQMLEYLKLKGLRCQNKIARKELFIAVGKLKHLKKVDLISTWKITKNNVDALVQALQSLRVLENLRLEIIYGLNESQGNELFIAIGKLKYLKKLDLDWEGITQTNVDALAKTLISLQVLEELLLSLEFCCRHDRNNNCDHKCDDKCDDECNHECNGECRRNCYNDCDADCKDELEHSYNLLDTKVLNAVKTLKCLRIFYFMGSELEIGIDT